MRSSFLLITHLASFIILAKKMPSHLLNTRYLLMVSDTKIPIVSLILKTLLHIFMYVFPYLIEEVFLYVRLPYFCYSSEKDAKRPIFQWVVEL